MEVDFDYLKSILSGKTDTAKRWVASRNGRRRRSKGHDKRATATSVHEPHTEFQVARRNENTSRNMVQGEARHTKRRTRTRVVNVLAMSILRLICELVDIDSVMRKFWIWVFTCDLLTRIVTNSFHHLCNHLSPNSLQKKKIKKIVSLIVIFSLLILRSLLACW